MAARAGSGGKIGSQRKRLSVVSGNALIDGLANATISGGRGGAASDLGAGAPTPKGSVTSVIASYDGKSKKGYAPYNPKKANQDSLVMLEHAPSNSVLLCVMDGHGEFGDKVSQDLKKNWPPMLFGHPSFASNDGVETALRESIAAAEEQMLKKMAGNADFSGTTFVCAVIRDNELWVANIGDSRVSCGIRDSSKPHGFLARNISEDHKPDSPGEKERILAAGGRVFAVQYDDGIDGPQRVWLGNMDIPGLAMGRSLGDTIAHSAGVSSEPEIFRETIDPGSMAFLVGASDGLWEFLSDQDVVDMIAKGNGQDPKAMVTELITTANNEWLKEEEVIDDTTVFVAYLNGYP